jgi:hypothetical protein
MLLFQTSLITGLILSVFGCLILFYKSNLQVALVSFPRSNIFSVISVSVATLWFLWRHVAFLGEADFGDYKLIIGSVALATALLSFVFVPDFLAVRGLAMLILLWSREVLDSAFLHSSVNRLVLVAIVYFLIIASIYFGAWPYKMRGLIDWLFQQTIRIKIFGFSAALSGILITLLSFTY